MNIPLWPLRPGIRLARSLLQHLLVFPLHRALARPFRVKGLEHLQGLESPALFIANHCSHVDTVSILRALPAPLRRRLAVAAAADYIFRIPSIGRVASLLFNTFPFAREGSAVRSSLDHCGRLAEQGWSLLIFPEGRLSPTGELLPFKPGVGVLVSKLHIPIVPVALFGAFKVLPDGRVLPKPGPLCVAFGAPMKFAGNATPVAVAAELHARMDALLTRPPELNQSG